MGAIGSSFADCTPGKDVAVASTALAHRASSTVKGGGRGRQHVSLMPMSTWVPDETQLQEVCTSAQLLGANKVSCLEVNLT